MFEELTNFFEKKAKIQNILLDYIDNDNEDENIFQSSLKDLLFENISKSNLTEDLYLLKDFLILLSTLCNNHQRTSKNKLILKIENILIQFKDKITNLLSGADIYMIFHENNRMILFLQKNSFFNINQDLILNKFYSSDYKIGYFYPELRELNKTKFLQAIKDYHLENFIQQSEENFNVFLQNRNEGENVDVIAKIVRNDLVDDLINFLERNHNFDAYNFLIEKSIFETNFFLQHTYSPKLINYACFFGSIKIIKYLITNKSQIPTDIWLYSIHGRNYEIIHLLEEYDTSPNFFKCFEMAIKCHHNEIAEYLLNRLTNVNNNNKVIELFLTCINHRNYQIILQLITSFPEIFNDNIKNIYLFKILFCIIRNEYIDIVKLFIKSNDGCINAQNSIFKYILLMKFNLNIFVSSF